MRSVCLCLCLLGMGCQSPKVTYKDFKRALARDCPQRATRICRQMKRKKALTLESCAQEVRVWCGMEQRCLLSCQYPDHRQRPSVCMKLCLGAEKAKIQAAFQQQLPRSCGARPSPKCIQRLRRKTLAAYEASLHKVGPPRKRKPIDGVYVLSGAPASGRQAVSPRHVSPRRPAASSRPAARRPAVRRPAASSRPVARRPSDSQPTSRPATSRPAMR